MRKRQNKVQVKYIIFALIVLLISLISIIFGGGVDGVYAAAVDYTSVIQDLETDENFNFEDYPQKADDYSLQVIQIAESTDNKLFLYVYNPCGVNRPLIATSINMSLTDTAVGTNLYNLTFLSSSGVFGKYLVNGVTVSKDTKRYYNITSIYRKWDKDIDKDTENDNTKNEVAYEVGKLITASTVNGVVKYTYEGVKVINVLNPYVGYIRYSDGSKYDPLLGMSWEYTDAHYVAFNTDLPIDVLMKADVSFCVQNYLGRNPLSSLEGEKREHEPITVKGTEKGSNTADGFRAKKYEWELIQKAEDFKKTDGLSEEVKKDLDGLSWVLIFYQTEVESRAGDMFFGTYVTDVSVLRLEFYTAGKLYNLGAVSGKQTGSKNPSNTNTEERENIFVWLAEKLGISVTAIKWIFSAIIILLLLGIVLPILAAFVPIVATVCKSILKAIWWVISLPFRGIAALIRKIRGN